MDLDLKKEQTKLKICEYLKQGMFKKDASKMSGISEDTYLRWYKEDTDFADRVEASVIKYKQSLIQIITHQAEKNGLLALKILQIRFPREWGYLSGGEEKFDSSSDIKYLADTIDNMIKMSDEESNPSFPVIASDTPLDINTKRN